jgi:protein-S-isoprenylcysteine O-methyltransferase Ste14
MRPNVNLPPQGTPSGTAAGFGYAILCYAAFQAAFAYFILFLNGVLVPKGIDDGAVRALPVALALNLGLIVLWGLQHSVMARKGFKERWTRVVPAHTERATFCLASSVALMVVMLGTTIARYAILGLQAAGWILLLAASHEIDHYETFGLKQPFYAMKGKSIPEPDFQTKRIYRFVRHPIQTGIFVGMWAAPTMSASHLMFAGLMTVYILVGLYFEERDLVRQFGERYLRYQREVPRLLPWKAPQPPELPREVRPAATDRT